MKNYKSLAFLFIILGMSTHYALGQLTTPQPSPVSTLKQRVGLTDITVEYSRPGIKNRVVFGDMVPYNELWRTGANMATTIELSDDVTINTKPLEKGKYAIFTIPGEREWTLIFNKNTNQAGTAAYSDNMDALRLIVPTEKLTESIETFTIDFSHFTSNGAKMNISWEKTRISVNVESDVDKKVMAQIERAFNPANQAPQYYQAASYFLDSGKDLDQALQWVNKALELYKQGGGEPFWVIHTKAKILAAKGDYKEAIKAAEHSKSLAAKAPSDFGYIGMNDKLIAELKKKK